MLLTVHGLIAANSILMVTRLSLLTVVIHKDTYSVKFIKSGQKQSFEYMLCGIVIQSITVTLVIIYRPPYSGKNPCTASMFTNEFVEFLPDILTQYSNVIILEDFNLHFESDD